MNEDRGPRVNKFLLMEGGPLYRIEKYVGLIKANAPLTARRAIIFGFVTWAPLLILCLLQGTAYGDKVPLPFLKDFSAYTRFLLAVPLLLIAENFLGPKIAEAAEHFVTSGVVVEKDFVRFDEAVGRGLKSRDSIRAEIIILILAYVISILAFRFASVHVSTWFATRTNGELSITWSGFWLILFCVPVYQFLLLRWFWRLILWFQFLGKVAQLDIELFPTHPDEAGGIGFIGEVQRFFGVLPFALSAGTAGLIARDIVYDKLPLTYFAPAIAVYIVIALLVIVGPLCVFTSKLLSTKRRAIYDYGALATEYTRAFDKKWIRRENPGGESLLGSGDIQSLADLGNSYSFITRTNPLPVKLRSLVNLVLMTLLPLTPLLLTIMPLKDLLKLLLKVVM